MHNIAWFTCSQLSVTVLSFHKLQFVIAEKDISFLICKVQSCLCIKLPLSPIEINFLLIIYIYIYVYILYIYILYITSEYLYTFYDSKNYIVVYIVCEYAYIIKKKWDILIGFFKGFKRKFHRWFYYHLEGPGNKREKEILNFGNLGE